MNITFSPQIKTLGYFEPNKVFDYKEIRDELMFFSCDMDFVRNHKDKSPITNKILDIFQDILAGTVIDNSAPNIVIDSRVNMLMPGQWPSIPGWHCDDIKRPFPGAQPDFELCDDGVQHFMVLVSNTTTPENCISGTEFIINDRIYDINHTKVWQSLHEQCEKDKDKKTRFVRERELVQFNQLAIHRASPAVKAGWRLFFRLSLTHRKPVNEIRNQVQIYVDPNNAGW